MEPDRRQQASQGDLLVKSSVEWDWAPKPLCTGPLVQARQNLKVGSCMELLLEGAHSLELPQLLAAEMLFRVVLAKLALWEALEQLVELSSAFSLKLVVVASF